MSGAIQSARSQVQVALRTSGTAPGAGPRQPVLVAAWIVFSTVCSCAGWVLSALHRLNAAGYAVVFLLGFGMVWTLRKRLFPRGLRGLNLRKGQRRFRKTFPLAFLILAVLAILGGTIHPPSNYDALTYRVPRVLHWLSQGQWHWIHTDFNQVNTRPCGMEWLSAPLIAFTRSERWLFVVNAVSFCLLPGLVFSVFRRGGVRPRVAWYWMWLLPTGYCYLLQAGSVSNDMFSAVYALAALDFALRARESGRVSHICLSALSMALLTGAKASNLPLLLPWAIALLPAWRTVLRRPLAVAAVVVPMLAVSFLPTAILNVVHCGDWTGIAAETREIGGAPVWLHLVANSIMYTASNLNPPVFPLASAWCRAANALTPAPMAALLQKHFEPNAAHWRLPEIQQEEDAGLGFGITILLAMSVLAGWLMRRRSGKVAGAVPGDLMTRLVCLAPWVSLVYLMTKLNMTGAVRYLASYYPLLAMGLLRSPVQAAVVRQGWWRFWALLACALAALLLVISPARPLWPAGWFIERFGPRLRSNRLGSLALNAYEAKASRSEVFTPVVARLPADASVVGFVAADFPETSVWKPFGSRRVLHVKYNESGEEMRQRGLRYVLLTTNHVNEPWGKWLQHQNATDLETFSLKMWGSLPPFEWHLVELNPATNSQPAGNPEPKTKPR